MVQMCKEDPYLKRDAYFNKLVPVIVTFIRNNKGAFGDEIIIEVKERDSPVFGETTLFLKNPQTKQLISKYGPPETWKELKLYVTSKQYQKQDGNVGWKLNFGWD